MNISEPFVSWRLYLIDFAVFRKDNGKTFNCEPDFRQRNGGFV